MSDALQKLVAKWRWESEALLHGTRPGEDGPMCAQKKLCADELDAVDKALVLAAPDLLEALEEMVRRYALHVTVRGGLQPIENQCDWEVRAAMRAIAKATGKCCDV